jgi:hypothetical protein
MKTCTKCQETKPLQDFFVRDKKTGRLHSQCKQCYRAHRVVYSAEHYRKYGDQYRERAKIKTALHVKMLDYLSDKSCTQCGESDLRVLDFDHIDPTTKSFSIARGLTNCLEWEAIFMEIQKCRILCANCHRKHTATQNNSYRLPI